MSIDLAADTQQYTIRLRPRGQVTIPRKVRDTLAMDEGDTLTLVQIGDAILLTAQPPRIFELADEIADMMAKEGVSLADLLEDLPNIREEIYQERFEHNAS